MFSIFVESNLSVTVMKKILLVLLASVALSSCTYTSYTIKGSYQLLNTNSNVETSAIDRNDSVYSDEYVTLIPEFADSSIALRVENNYNSTIRVLWDWSAYINAGGVSHRVIHVGTKFVDKEKAQVPSVIPAGAHINETIVPVDNVEWNGSSGWDITPFRPQLGCESVTYETLKEAEDALLWCDEERSGRVESKLVLPIEIDGRVVEYTLTFGNYDMKIYKDEKEYGVAAIPICAAGLIVIAVACGL